LNDKEVKIMISYLVVTYLVLGILTIVLMAYDPYSRSFDFGLSDGWEFWWWQRYLLWLIIVIASPFFFIKELYTKLTEIKYVRQWRTKGSFTKKL
jgi:hypothetical protein